MKYLSYKVSFYCAKIIISFLLTIYLSLMDSRAFSFDISYSTHFGGSSDTVGYGIAVDKNGNAFITGFTHSFDLPVTEGAYQKSNTRFIDAFMAKINNTGNITYATYLGGNGWDHGRDITVDSKGNVYITGFTNSTDFPLKNALQNTNKGMRDVFITKFDPEGSIVFSTYLGGSGDDVGNAIAVDSGGNIYVTGRTTSTDFLLKNPIQEKNSGGWDVFIAKISEDGNSIIYSTYLGGSNWDEGRAIAIDHLENVYITGYTSSGDFMTVRPLQKEYAGDTDAFLAKIDRNGKLYYSTYLGGKGFDSGDSLAVDGKGNVFITGNTSSKDFPVSNPIQDTYEGESDVFLRKINPKGNILFSTFLGGDSLDNGRYLALDPEGNIYIIGLTKSKDFPVKDPIQKANGGGIDAFMTKIDRKGSRIFYSTFLGGKSYDSGKGIAVGPDRNIYIGGTTESKDFPAGDPAIKKKIDYSHAFVTRIKQNIKAGDSKGKTAGHNIEIS